jgi:hypothetical protein
MTPSFPVVELFDRLAVAQIKWAKTHDNHAELAWYQSQVVHYDFSKVADLFEELKKVHNQIWILESELKSGRECELSLEEIGRRAIVIRNFNHTRIAIKNQLAKILDCPVQEIKKDHLSE